MAEEADSLRGEKDAKLQKAKALVKTLVQDGFQPIVFCRFIPTAEYVAEELRKTLKKVEVAAVTGLLPPAERKRRVLELSRSPRRVLVATDCLSEGINLQEMFDAVVHYDLAWNPTRHEQREGRVDRYGQNSKKVRVSTYYGSDNPIDGVVLGVLLRKHERIRSSLGVSVPVPVDTENVMKAIFHASLLRSDPTQLRLDFELPESRELEAEWRKAAERERLSRTLFAQHSIKPDEVARELNSVRRSIGSGVDVAWFLEEVLSSLGGRVERGPVTRFDLREVPSAVRDGMSENRDTDEISAAFSPPVPDGAVLLHRTHPLVSGLAGYVLDTSLDPLLAAKSVARRAGVIRTRAVPKRTTLLLLRLRFHLLTRRASEETALLVEDWRLAAFWGAPASPEWLSDEQAESLFLLRPDANVPIDQARTHLSKILPDLVALESPLVEIAGERGTEILEAHRRVRRATRATGITQKIEAQLPVDLLGVYLYLPAE
jgi:hypothetical protein